MAKLKYEHQKLAEEPENSYHAFNFFVTAWHMCEWYSQDSGVRTKLRNDNPILRICEHLAIGAKHFEPKSDQHTSVIETKSTTVWSYSLGDIWADGVWAEWLIVKLDGEARERYGSSIRADELSNHAIEFWQTQLNSD